MSTSFANPAVTFARSLSDRTGRHICVHCVKRIGMVVALLIMRWLWREPFSAIQ
jgi:hypothetical protein